MKNTNFVEGGGCSFSHSSRTEKKARARNPEYLLKAVGNQTKTATLRQAGPAHLVERKGHF